MPAANFLYSLRDEILRRLLRNAGLLLFGQTAASVLNLIAVALTARALGPEGFGLLATIHAYAMAWDRLANFQSFEVLIKFGADLLQRLRIDSFKALVKLTLILDGSSAVAGALLAALAAGVMGSWFGWDQSAIDMAVLYCLVILFNLSGTPLGLLRLLDRYVPLSIYQIVAALVRLLGVAVVWSLGGSLRDFLLVWIAADIAGKAYLVVAAWTALRSSGYRDIAKSRSLALLRTSPEIPKFAVMSHLISSLRLGTREVDTLIVAGLLGAGSAGLYKLAKQFASVLEKASEPLYSVVYPELSRLVAAGNHKSFMRLIAQTAAIAGAVGLAGWLIFALFGEQLLRLVAGSEYMAAYGVLVGYAFATAIATACTPLQPAILSLGRPQSSLAALLVSTIVYLVALVFLIQVFDLAGAGIAYVVFYLIWGLLMILAIRRWRICEGPQSAG